MRSLMRGVLLVIASTSLELAKFSAHGETIAPPLRRISAASRIIPPRSLVTIPILIHGIGTESAAGFSLHFEPSRLNFKSAKPGPGLGDMTLIVNSNRVPLGQLGFALALPAGRTVQPGQSVLIELGFLASSISGPTPLLFTNVPARMELVDLNANILSVAFDPGIVTIQRSNFGQVAAEFSSPKRSMVTLNWDAETGARYQVQGWDSNSTSRWRVLHEITATNGAMRFAIPYVPLESSLYRIQRAGFDSSSPTAMGGPSGSK